MRFSAVTRRAFLVGIGVLAMTSVVRAVPYQVQEQTNSTWSTEWNDTVRKRQVPVKIYFPSGTGPFPVIVFSHGLGGTRNNYSYLGEYWSKHGYVSVHLQHIGSDDAVWRFGGGLAQMRTAMTPANATARAQDVSYALDQLTTLNKDEKWPLHGKLDLSKVGMAGHSFGANTTLIVSGMKTLNGEMKDKRIQCSVALSSPPPSAKNYDLLYGDIKIPMLHMTGTNDLSPVDARDMPATTRRIPFDNIKGADSYLLTFTGGDHMVFSGRPRPLPVATDARNHAIIQESTLAFWDAYLKDSKEAQNWLRDEFKKEVGTSGVLESK